MTVTSRRIAQLLDEGFRGVKTFPEKNRHELVMAFEKWNETSTNTETIVRQIVYKYSPIILESNARTTFTIASGGTIDLAEHTLTLSDDIALDGNGHTLALSANATVGGTNTGDVTLATTSGLALSGQVLNVGAGDGIDVLTNTVAVDCTDLLGTGISESGNNFIVDQTFSPTWTGSHTFQNTLTTRHLLPELTDTYDIGSTTKLYRHGYLSELDAVIFSENTISLVGGWLMLPKDSGTLPSDMADDATTYDFGEVMTVNDFIVMRAALKVEYIKIGSLVSGTNYNITRNLDGTGANAWVAGTPYAVLGNEGDGRIELNSGVGNKITILQQGSTYNDQDTLLTIGDNGISIVPSTSSTDKRAYTFSNELGTIVYSGLYANGDTESKHSCELKALALTDIASDIKIWAASPATKRTSVSLAVESGVVAASFALYADSDDTPTTKAILNTRLTIDENSTTALLVEQDGVKDNVLVVDTTNGAVGIMQAATSGVPLSVYGRGDGGSVLRLNTSRAWEFQQENADGAGAYLRLRDLNTNKAFYIDTSGVFAIRKADAASTIAHFDCANSRLGLNDTAPAEVLDVTGNANVTGVYKVDDVQVVSNRVIDARIDDAINSGDATTDGVIDAIRDALITHGLIAAA